MKREDYKKIMLNVFGTLLLLIGILAVLNSIYINNLSQIFWMCYLSLVLIGIGILKRNSLLITSQIYILTIPVMIWNIDFFYQLIMQKPWLGITDYFFNGNLLTLSKIITLQHLFTIPISLYALYEIKRDKKDEWKLSIIQLTILYFITSIMTKEEENINCVFESCINLPIGINYKITWFIISFLMVFTTAIMINCIPSFSTKN